MLENLHLDNSNEITNNSKWKKIIYEEGGIRIFQTDTHSPFHKNSNRDIQQLQRFLLCQMKQYDSPLQLWDKAFVCHDKIFSHMD